jgi:hypothetical protein
MVSALSNEKVEETDVFVMQDTRITEPYIDVHGLKVVARWNCFF